VIRKNFFGQFLAGFEKCYNIKKSVIVGKRKTRKKFYKELLAELIEIVYIIVENFALL
jgi:hypothetical protein